MKFFRKPLSFILKQQKAPIWPSALRAVYARTTSYTGFASFWMLLAVMYETVAKKHINNISWLPNLSFVDFVVIFVVGFLIAMVIEWKIMIPSGYAYQNEQEYKHRSPIREDLDKIKKKLGIED